MSQNLYRYLFYAMCIIIGTGVQVMIAFVFYSIGHALGYEKGTLDAWDDASRLHHNSEKNDAVDKEFETLATEGEQE